MDIARAKEIASTLDRVTAPHYKLTPVDEAFLIECSQMDEREHELIDQIRFGD